MTLRGPDGIVNVFWRGPDNSVWTLRQNVINSAYATVEKLTSNAASDPAATLNADGRISVFYNGTNAELCHIGQQNTDYASWVPAQNLGRHRRQQHPGPRPHPRR
ncbi:hypothetical protein ACIRO3_34650 [Streptomyces sp. NPDC102278]|uniref:hypothetical protein n=1 Tax=Streptomyces sp. NPDC102278 TaxID=3366152 RepID=UPI0038046C0E